MTNNDLISREALKKTFDEYIKANPKVSGVFELGKFIIDNAPTVLHDNYSMGYQDGVRKVLSEKPQGEWIDYSEEDGYIECPICGHATNCNDNIDELHYCWNCGAYLQKERYQQTVGL